MTQNMDLFAILRKLKQYTGTVGYNWLPPQDRNIFSTSPASLSDGNARSLGLGKSFINISVILLTLRFPLETAGKRVGIL